MNETIELDKVTQPYIDKLTYQGKEFINQTMAEVQKALEPIILQKIPNKCAPTTPTLIL